MRRSRRARQVTKFTDIRLPNDRMSAGGFIEFNYALYLCQIGAHLGRRLISIGRILPQRFIDHRLKLMRDRLRARVCDENWGRLTLEHGHQRVSVCLSAEWSLLRQHFIKKYSAAPDVGSLIY